MTARLAVVDDDAAFTTFLQTLLRSRGYEVDVYHSGGSLLEALRGGVQPQVVLLDVLMPDLDGLETLRAIRLAHPAAQVIMLSGRQAPATIVEAVRLGAADYVLKPGDPDGLGEAALEAAIRNALERDSLSAEVARLGTLVAEDPEGALPCWSSGPSMQPVMTMVERVADSDVGVLLHDVDDVGCRAVGVLRRGGLEGRHLALASSAECVGRQGHGERGEDQDDEQLGAGTAGVKRRLLGHRRGNEHDRRVERRLGHGRRGGGEYWDAEMPFPCAPGINTRHHARAARQHFLGPERALLAGDALHHHAVGAPHDHRAAFTAACTASSMRS